MNGVVHARDLIKQRHKRLDNNKKKYDKILEVCNNRIKAVNELTNDTNLTFELPELIGMTMLNYNKQECGEYMKKILQENGYIVKIYNIKYISVSWGETEVEKKEIIKKQDENLDVLLRLSNTSKKIKKTK